MDDFDSLEKKIIACRRCPRLVEWRERVAREKVRRYRDQEYWGRPVPAFGTPDARLVIIGLAPAAHGGNRTGRIFTGDRSGNWLYEVLYEYGFANQPHSVSRDDGLEMNDCLITAMLRCAPPGTSRCRRKFVTAAEYLRRELQLAVNARVVVALGHIAFRGFLKLWKETRTVSVIKMSFFVMVANGRCPAGSCFSLRIIRASQNTQTGSLRARCSMRCSAGHDCSWTPESGVLMLPFLHVDARLSDPCDAGIKIRSVRRACRFRFSLERDFHFVPGQYATFWLTHGKTLARPYSIASSPSEKRSLEFYINFVREGEAHPSLWDPEVITGLTRGDPGTHAAVTGPKGAL